MTINIVEHKPWTNDEITMRIAMLEDMLDRTVRDDIQRIGLQREIATWKELLRRRA